MRVAGSAHVRSMLSRLPHSPQVLVTPRDRVLGFRLASEGCLAVGGDFDMDAFVGASLFDLGTEGQGVLVRGRCGLLEDDREAAGCHDIAKQRGLLAEEHTLFLRES